MNKYKDFNDEEMLVLSSGRREVWDGSQDKSRNAVSAEEMGRFTWYEWKHMPKAEIIKRINEEIKRIGGPDAVNFDVCLLNKARKEKLMQLFLYNNNGEYHHIRIKNRWREYGYFAISEHKLKSADASDFDDNAKRLNSPLTIGIFQKRNYYYGKWRDTFTTYVGVIDGDHLCYYDFQDDPDLFPLSREELESAKIRKTKLPDDEYRYKGFKTFKTVAAFTEAFPEYECRSTELQILIEERENDRKKCQKK